MNGKTKTAIHHRRRHTCVKLNTHKDTPIAPFHTAATLFVIHNNLNNDSVTISTFADVNSSSRQHQRKISVE